MAHLGQGEPEGTTRARDAIVAALVLGAWFAFSSLGKAQKGKKSFFDKWLKR
jgi:hypothetical protein